MASQYPLVIYKDKNYSGTSAGLTYGNYGDLGPSTGVPRNSMSSMKIAPFTRITLYKDIYFTGTSYTVDGPLEVPDLSQFMGGINDTIASISVVEITPTLDVQLACCRGTAPSYQCGGYTPGSPQCTGVFRDYCSRNMNTAECQTWCSTHPDICDPMVVQYCAVNPNDPYCSCINSPAYTKNIANPSCVDRKCITSGYRTLNMRETPCPSVVTCDIQYNLQNSGVMLSNQTPIQQNCGTSTGVPSGTPTGTVTGTGVAPSQGNIAIGSNAILIFLIFLFFMILAVMASVVVYTIKYGS